MNWETRERVDGRCATDPNDHRPLRDESEDELVVVHDRSRSSSGMRSARRGRLYDARPRKPTLLVCRTRSRHRKNGRSITKCSANAAKSEEVAHASNIAPPSAATPMLASADCVT
jgi:hypothetical protein